MGKKPNTVVDLRIYSTQTGYIGTVLAKELNDWADKNHCHIHIPHNVGDFVSFNDVLFEIFILKSTQQHDFATQDDLTKTLNQYVHIQPQRNMYEAPRYGIMVLGEIGHRTLSVGVNDPATADRVLTLITQLLIDTKADENNDKTGYEHISIMPLRADMFITPLFLPLARDGLNSFDFMMHMLVCLAKICNNAPELLMRESALTQAKKIYDMAYHHYEYEADKKVIKQVWQSHFGDIS